MLSITNGPEALTVADFPAAATIRTGASGDGVEMTLVTAVVQSNQYIIYMSGYASSDTFAAQFPTFAGMMNSLHILTDEAPVAKENDGADNVLPAHSIYASDGECFLDISDTATHPNSEALSQKRDCRHLRTMPRTEYLSSHLQIQFYS